MLHPLTGKETADPQVLHRRSARLEMFSDGFTVLSIGDVWGVMSNDPGQYEQYPAHDVFRDCAEGHVIQFGLGLGADWLRTRAKVRWTTIVEPNPDVIWLCAERIDPSWEGLQLQPGERATSLRGVTLFCETALAFVTVPPTGSLYDRAFFDFEPLGYDDEDMHIWTRLISNCMTPESRTIFWQSDPTRPVEVAGVH